MAGSFEVSTDRTHRDVPQASRREAARANVYASVTGEGRQGDVAASTPMVPDGTASRYEAGPLLGQGGMGEVVLSLDRRIGRQVARKTLLPEMSSERALARFVREVRVQGQLEHPSVVPVYDFGVDDDGGPFFTMKRVRGETLAHILERLAKDDATYALRFSRHKLLSAFRQVCLAVEYAHLRGVMHRDLKPSNVMLGDFGEVYVLDWGLAKLRTDGDDATDLARDAATTAPDTAVRAPIRDPHADAGKTGMDDMIGTPAYMAPEQFGAGRSQFDTRQDIFALGAILFEILTLARYRPGASFATLLPSLIREADRQQPTRPSEKVPDVSPELDDACARALATQPGSRIASAGALAEVIERYLEGDRDQGMRRSMAAALLASARAKIAGSQNDAGARLDAMRDAIKALALTPDDVKAQKMLLSLVVDGSGTLTPEGEREFEAKEFEVDTHALVVGQLGLCTWFLVIPLVLSIGVRNWLPVGVMIGLTAATIAYMELLRRWRTRASVHVMILASMLATTLGLASCWLGPFVLVPVATCSIAIVFASRCKKSERPWLVLIWSLGVLVPFALELLHVLPPAYSFVGGDLVLHARALNLPEGRTLAGLAYTALTFMVLPMFFVGRLRDRQLESDRRSFVQAWHLRQLFPAAGEKNDAAS